MCPTVGIRNLIEFTVKIGFIGACAIPTARLQLSSVMRCSDSE